MFAEGKYTLPIALTEEEIAQKQAEYFENNRKLRAADMSLVVAKGLHKTVSVPLKKRNELLDHQIQEGVEERTIYAIEFVNEDNATMDYIDPQNNDVVLHSRPLTPSERVQYKIKFGRRQRQEA